MQQSGGWPLPSRLMFGTSAFALYTLMGAAAYAQDTDVIETVTVTGFRASLEKALDMKRDALDATDSIMAEDVAKFPDMNVTESLQRIPGVSITRDSGEGREITVRGLGAQFSRVRINGMEALTTVTGEDTNTSTNSNVNRNRAFDFNVFASELFSQLTVHKSASAELEEGSLGATVDLHTGHPFDHSGPVFTTSVQYGYQSMAGSSNPRVAILASNTFLGGRLGVLVSGAYGITNTLEQGSSTVRWYNDGTSDSSTGSSGYQYASVCTDAGTTCSSSGTTYNEANAAFHARFPRFDYITLHEKRLGLTGSVQWQPDDKTTFTLDALFADFAQVRQEQQLEANSFSVSGSGTTYAYTNTNTSTANSVTSLAMHNITLVNFSASDIDANNSLTRVEAANVGLRVEHRLDDLDTRFMQVTLDGTRQFSEKLKVHALMGWSESHNRNPNETNLTADYGCINSTSSAACKTGGAGTVSDPYIADFSKGNIPYISYGNVDVSSSDGWFLSQIRIGSNSVSNSFRTAVADGEYVVTDVFKISGGIDYRNFGFVTTKYGRSNGTTSSMDTSIPAAVRSIPLSEYMTTVHMHNIDLPSGSTSTWWVPDLNKAASLMHLYDQSVYSTTGSGACASGCGAFRLGREASLGSNGSVRENDYGAWLQIGWDSQIFNMPFRGNIGGRYVLTETQSSGYLLNAATYDPQMTVANQTYHDFLPSLNATLSPEDDFLIRFNASFAMARPNLASMLPGGSISASGGGSSRSVTISNPTLKPIRSKNVDLSFEWYYDKGAMISVAGFYKHIDSTIQTIKNDIVFSSNPYGLDDSLAVAACGSSYGSACNESLKWTFSTPENKKGAPLYGTEFNWQQPLTFLPGLWSNLGVMANYTYVQAQQKYYDTSGNVYLTADLTNLSRTSYNATVYYDDQVFQARLTGAFRSHYCVDASVTNLNNGTFVDSTFNLDASSTYKFSDSIMFTFDAINLTNQAQKMYVDSSAERPYIYHETGRVFYIGAKYTY